MVYFLYFKKKIQIHCRNAKFNVTVFTFVHHRLKAIMTIIHIKRKHNSPQLLVIWTVTVTACWHSVNVISKSVRHQACCGVLRHPWKKVVPRGLTIEQQH